MEPSFKERICLTPDFKARISRGPSLRGTDLSHAEIWLVNFPRGLWGQSPVPMGLADLNTSSPTTGVKAELRKELGAGITDAQLLRRLVQRLYPILRDDPPQWVDEGTWSRYSKAGEPPPDELAHYLAGMACERDDTTPITEGLAIRAKIWSEDDDKRRYVKPLAEALLKADCKGATTLSEETRAKLQNYVASD
jgi:hypothetical protein